MNDLIDYLNKNALVIIALIYSMLSLFVVVDLKDRVKKLEERLKINSNTEE